MATSPRPGAPGAGGSSRPGSATSTRTPSKSRATTAAVSPPAGSSAGSSAAPAAGSSARVPAPGSGHLLGYARVSTTEQNTDLQHDDLTAAGCWRIWTDHASGSLERRPQLDLVLEALRPGDTLVVWRLDRLGRSLRHLIDTVTDLDTRGVGFRSLTEALDTTTPGGRLVFHVFGAMAQFEREIIRDRTLAGLAAARARGRRGGRPMKLSPAQQAMAVRLYTERAHTAAQIGALLGVSRTSVYRVLARQTAGHPTTDTTGELGREAAAQGRRSQRSTESDQRPGR